MLIEPYSSNWIRQFESIQQELDNSLGDTNYFIEHVGSTAVPNLDAKPIIDIDIVYNTTEDFEKIKCCLETIGYFHNGNQGIDDREVFKRNGTTSNGILDSINHHLYVCPADSKALERHILSRNFLRKHQWARVKYQQLKYELADMAHQDRKVYAALKELHINSFIDSIVKEEKLVTR